MQLHFHKRESEIDLSCVNGHRLFLYGTSAVMDTKVQIHTCRGLSVQGIITRAAVKSNAVFL